MKTEVTTYSLEMTNPSQLRPSRYAGTNVALTQVEIPNPEYNRFFYTAIGGSCYWTDRLGWTYEQWMAWLDRPDLETWVLYVAGTPAGYFELERQAEDSVEIAYFGLLHQFIGKGLGGYLLTSAIRRAWSMAGTKRVWVHTCTLDHPNALAAYQARGLRLFKEEVHWQTLPAQVPSPWLDAERVRSGE